MKRVFGIVLLTCIACACGSPETTRTRGGGPGADVRNRPPTVRMHEGSEPFWNTPAKIQHGYAPRESARNAQQLSLQ
jgi:hypothetical protein